MKVKEVKKAANKQDKRNLRILTYFLILLTLILFGYLFYTYSKPKTILKTANITRILDGDTLDTTIGKVRLLGINTPEKGQYYYNESTAFLYQLKDKEVTLEIKGKDMFNRTLAYLYYQDKMIEEEILAGGYGHYYSYSADKYSSKLKADENKAITKEIGIWKKSSDECAKCIVLVEINKKEPEEYVLLENKCNFNCDLHNWTIKDETASHLQKLYFSINAGKQKHIYFEGAIWNDDHDTLFLRDDSGLLVLWYRY